MMNADHTGSYYFWLAEQNFEALPDDAAQGSAKPRIPSDWKSPSIGKTIEDAFRSIATSPLDKRLDTQIMVVLDGRLYKQEDWLVSYRIDEQGGKSSIPARLNSLLIGCMATQIITGYKTGSAVESHRENNLARVDCMTYNSRFGSRSDRMFSSEWSVVSKTMLREEMLDG